MNPNNTRIEPTFGQSDTENMNNSTQSISVSSKTSPGHTFTSELKQSATETTSATSATTKLPQSTPENTTPTQPKAAGFAFAPVSEKTEHAATTAEKQTTTPTQSAPHTASKESELERIIPVQTANNPEKRSPITIVPAKYRRLILVILLAIALLLVFILLKPTPPKTVEALEDQGTSLPIEFRPVDEAEAKRAEEEAKALQEQQQAEQTAQPSVSAETRTATETTTTVQEPTQAVKHNEQPAPVQQTVTTAPVKTVNKPATVEVAKKPQGSQSVIHQAETVKNVVKHDPKKAEPVKSAPVKPTPTVTKPKAETTPTTVSKTQTANGVVSSKILTVPKGVSLMQVFRDHQLNISDVNAMSKVNNAVSNLKVGEKVTVRLDKNNRVVEMQIGAGKYIRQSNGSYIFR